MCSSARARAFAMRSINVKAAHVCVCVLVNACVCSGLQACTCACAGAHIQPTAWELYLPEFITQEIIFSLTRVHSAGAYTVFFLARAFVCPLRPGEEFEAGAGA